MSTPRGAGAGAAVGAAAGTGEGERPRLGRDALRSVSWRRCSVSALMKALARARSCAGNARASTAGRALGGQ